MPSMITGVSGLQRELRLCPNETQTRVVFVSEVIPDVDRYHNTFWPGGVALIDLLGGTYDLDPLFFEQMISNDGRKQRPFDFHLQGDNSLQQSYLTDCLSRSILSLNVEHGLRVEYQNCPTNIWATATNDPRHRDCQVMVVYLRIPPTIRYKLGSNTCCRPHDRVMPYPSIGHFSEILAIIQRYSKDSIHSATCNPIEFLIPLFNIMQLKFLAEMTQLRGSHQSWEEQRRDLSSAEMADFDADRSRKWFRARSMVEQFQAAYDCILEFSEYTLSISATGNLQSTRDKLLDEVLKKHSRLLQKGRILEQHVRETIQVNVGNLSLLESRKSIQQADSVGRISLLGFDFLPLSLVMSFFGMNIRQLTRTGALWKAFLIAMAVMCVSVMAICAWLWRKTRRAHFFTLVPLVPFVPFFVPAYFFSYLFVLPVWRKYFKKDTLCGPIIQKLHSTLLGSLIFLRKWWNLRKN